jgi:hypothetical protein
MATNYKQLFSKIKYYDKYASQKQEKSIVPPESKPGAHINGFPKGMTGTKVTLNKPSLIRLPGSLAGDALIW